MKLFLPVAILFTVALVTEAKQDLVSYHLEDAGLEVDSPCAKSRTCLKNKCQYMNVGKLVGAQEKEEVKGKVEAETAAAFGRLKKEGDGTVADDTCSVWGKTENGGRDVKAPKAFSTVHPWHTNNFVFGDSCSPVTKMSDARGIEFEVSQLEMQGRYKIIGLGRKTKDPRGANPKNNPEVGVISYGVYFQECKKCHDSDTAIMSIYDRNYDASAVASAVSSLATAAKTGDADKIKTANEAAAMQLGGEEAQMDGLFQYQQHFTHEHHHRIRNCYHHWHRRHYRCDHDWNTKRSLPVWDYCGKAEYHERYEAKRTFCGRVFNGDQIAVRLNADTDKFEVFVNSKLRYRSPRKVVYPADGYIAAASFATPDGEFINTEWSGGETKVTLDADRDKPTCYPRVISSDGDGMDNRHTLTTEKGGVGLGMDRCKIATHLTTRTTTSDLLSKLQAKFTSSESQRAISNVRAGLDNYDYYRTVDGKLFCKIFNKVSQFNLIGSSNSWAKQLAKNGVSKVQWKATGKPACTPDFADFAPVPNGAEGVTNGVEIGEERFWERYNNGYLSDKMKFYAKGKDGVAWPREKLSFSVKPNGANSKFLAHYQCKDGNDLCECGNQFRVVANLAGKNVTEYNVIINSNSVAYCDCNGVGNCGVRYDCSGRRRRLLTTKSMRSGQC